MFIGESISQSTSILNFVDVDPLLLAVPFLQKSRGAVTSEKQGYFKQIDEIFDATGGSAISSFATAMKTLQANERLFRNLEKICDVKSHDPDKKLDFFRLNDTKLTAYMADKLAKAETLFTAKQKYFEFQKLATKETIEDKVFFGLEYAYNSLPSDLFVSLVLTPKNITYNEFNTFKRRRDNVAKYDFYSTENENQEDNNGSAQKKKKEVTTTKTSTAELKNQ